MGTLQPLGWKNIGCSATVLNWILEGVPLHLDSVPSPCQLPNHVKGFTAESFVDQQVTELLVHTSYLPTGSTFVLPLSVVHKETVSVP